MCSDGFPYKIRADRHCISISIRCCGIGAFTEYGSSDMVERIRSLFMAFHIINQPANHERWHVLVLLSIFRILEKFSTSHRVTMEQDTHEKPAQIIGSDFFKIMLEMNLTWQSQLLQILHLEKSDPVKGSVDQYGQRRNG